MSPPPGRSQGGLAPPRGDGAQRQGGRPLSPQGRLLLVPAPLTQQAAPRPWLCEADRATVAGLSTFYVETPKIARHWLQALPVAAALQSLHIRPLPQADARTEWRDWLAPMLAGETVGLITDAGCPGVADPGAHLVRAAHAAGIEVHPLVGPSSLLLALMASGLNGQRFSFQGYLPIAREERRLAIARLARHSAGEQETVLLIETPYRNQAMAESLIEHLPAAGRLCIAVDLCGKSQSIRCRQVAAWRQSLPALPGRLPAVFLFLC